MIKRSLLISLFILLLIKSIIAFDFKQASVSCSNLVIRQSATCTFTLGRTLTNNLTPTPWNTQLVPAGSNIVIQFPTEYSNYNLNAITCSSITIDSNIFSNIMVTLIGSNIILQNLITVATAIKQVTIVLDNIKNPEPALKTSGFVGIIGNDVAMPRAPATNMLQLISGSLVSSSAIFNNGFVSRTDSLLISLTSISVLPYNAIVVITFPNFYVRDPSFQPVVNVNLVDCTTVLNTYGINCNGNSSANSVIVTNSIPVGGSLTTSFTLSQIMVPPSVQQIDTITITTMSSTGIIYDTGTCLLSNIHSVIMTSLSYSTSQPIVVNSQNILNFTIPLQTPFFMTDNIVVSFSTPYLPVFTLINLAGGALIHVPGSASIYTDLTYYINSNTSLLLNASTNVDLQANSVLYLQIANIIAPVSIGISPTVTISIYQASYLKARGTVSITAIANQLKNMISQVIDSTIGVNSVYRISFVTSDAIPSTGMIQIMFPLQLTVNYLLTKVTVNGVTSIFTISGYLNQIKIKSFPSISANSTVTIQLTKLGNPVQTDTIKTSLIIKCYYSSNTMDLINSGSYVPTELVYIGTQSISYQVISSSQIVMAQNVSLIFTIQTQIGVPYGGSLKIIIFNMVSFVTNTSCILTIIGTTNITIPLPCSIGVVNSTNNQIHISNLTFILLPNATFVVTVVSAFTNPASTKPIAHFVIVSYSNALLQLQRSSQTSFSYLTISKPSGLLSFSISRSSRVNSNPCDYSFTVQQPSIFSTDAADTNIIQLQFPPQNILTFAHCPTCSIDTTLNTIHVTLDNTAISNLNTISLTIYNITNAPSFQPPTKNISFTSILNANYFYSKGLVADNYEITINNGLSVLTLTNSTLYSSFLLGSTNSLTVAVTLDNPYISVYILTLSTLFVPGSIVCNVLPASTCSYNSTKMIFTIIRPPSPATLLTFIINGFKNPQSYANIPIISSIQGYSSSNYIVNQYSGTLLSWTPKCVFPCQTCSSTNTSTCLTCYSNISISNYIYYYPALKTCLTACSSSQILSGSICVDCVSPCLTCSLSVNNCTSCNTLTSSPYYFNFTCRNVTSCPLYYYADPTFRCQPCTFPCLDCFNASRCISCANGTFMYQNNCISTCPGGFTVSNSVNKTCDLCSSSCATCLGVVDNCTTCGAGTIKFNGQCLTNCSASLYIYIDQCVANCVSPCLTCQIHADTCLSCTTNSSSFLYLLNGRCLTLCPPFYYKNISTMTCDSCSSLGLHCGNCMSNQNCTIFGGATICSLQKQYICLVCDSNYTYFFNQTTGVYVCVAQIPDGYASVNWIAQLCVSPCLTCINFTYQCTSCLALNYYQGLCLATCPAGYYSKIVNILFNSINTSTLQCTLCTAPCLTCLNQTACLKCNSTTYYNGNNQCIDGSLCPTFTYPNNTYQNCTPCSSPCFDCFSYFNCRSCINNTYLYNSSCLSNCPKGYYNNITLLACQPCSPPCQYCASSASICTACVSNTFYYSYNYSCLLECPLTFVKNAELQICQNCSLPCLQCDYLVCHRCSVINSTIYYIYQQSCITTCPDGYFGDSNSLNYSCQLCDISCRTCINSSTTCIYCNNSYKVLPTGLCVVNCPSNLPIIKFISNQYHCLSCSDTLCLTCSVLDKCLACLNSSLILISGKCYAECPYPLVKAVDNITNLLICEQPVPVDPAVAQIQAATNEGSTLILPIDFPCSILAGVLSLISLFVKAYQSCCKDNSNALLMPMLSASLAFPQFVALCLAGGSYFYLRYKIFINSPSSWDVFIYIYSSCILITVMLGLYTLIIQTKILWQDNVYSKWNKHANCFQKLYQYIINVVTLLNFKVVHSLWCGIRSMPLLQSANKLNFIRIPSAISVIVSLAFTANTILLLKFHSELSMIYYDTLIVVAVSAIFSLLALRRPLDFFVQQLNNQPSLPLNKRVTDSDSYLKGPMKPLFDDSLIQRKSKKSLLFDSQSEQNQQDSKYSQSNHPLSSQRSTVRLQNKSMQFSKIETSSILQNHSSDINTSQIVSIQCEAEPSINNQDRLQNIYTRQILKDSKQQNQSQYNDLLPTNMAIVDLGDNQSYSAEGDEQIGYGESVLPEQLQPGYDFLKREGPSPPDHIKANLSYSNIFNHNNSNYSQNLSLNSHRNHHINLQGLSSQISQQIQFISQHNGESYFKDEQKSKNVNNSVSIQVGNVSIDSNSVGVNSKLGQSIAGAIPLLLGDQFVEKSSFMQNISSNQSHLVQKYKKGTAVVQNNKKRTTESRKVEPNDSWRDSKLEMIYQNKDSNSAKASLKQSIRQSIKPANSKQQSQYASHNSSKRQQDFIIIMKPKQKQSQYAVNNDNQYSHKSQFESIISKTVQNQQILSNNNIIKTEHVESESQEQDQSQLNFMNISMDDSQMIEKERNKYDIEEPSQIDNYAGSQNRLSQQQEDVTITNSNFILPRVKPMLRRKQQSIKQSQKQINQQLKCMNQSKNQIAQKYSFVKQYQRRQVNQSEMAKISQDVSMDNGSQQQIMINTNKVKKQSSVDGQLNENESLENSLVGGNRKSMMISKLIFEDKNQKLKQDQSQKQQLKNESEDKLKNSYASLDNNQQYSWSKSEVSIKKNGINHSKVEQIQNEDDLIEEDDSIEEDNLIEEGIESIVITNKISERQSQNYQQQPYLEPAKEPNYQERADLENEGNQFRIKTTRKRRNKKENKEKQKIIYVEDKKYRSLKRQAKKIEQQTIVNSKLQKNIQNSYAGLNSSAVNRNSQQKSRSRDKERNSNSPARLRSVYLLKQTQNEAQVKKQ